jgi:hypothetical protein
MPKTRLEKKRRIEQAASSALETEVKLNESRLAAAVPDSSLFDRDSDLPRRKPKPSLPPRYSTVPDVKPAAAEYFDLWGTPPPDSLPKNICKPKSKPATFSCGGATFFTQDCDSKLIRLGIRWITPKRLVLKRFFIASLSF